MCEVGGFPSALRIAHRRAEPGWRAAVLEDEASRHAFHLRASEEVCDGQELGLTHLAHALHRLQRTQSA